MTRQRKCLIIIIIMTLIEFDRNELDNHPEEYNKLLLYILERKKIEVLRTQHSFEPQKKEKNPPSGYIQ